VQSLKPAPGQRVTKVHDRDGLFLHVSTGGTKSWVLRYRIYGKERSATLGRYPDVRLKKARERAQEARGLLADGIDPVQHKRRQRAEAAANDAARFSVVADEWQKRQTWTPPTRKQYERLFKVDVFPPLGRLPITDINAADVQSVVDKAAERGQVVPTHVLLLIRGVMSYAVTKRLIPYSPAREVHAPKRPRGVRRSYRHLEGTSAVTTLLERLDGYAGRPETVIGLRLLLLTFVRPSELREARWAEFDLAAVDANHHPAPTWNIPAARMKRRRPHVVPLSAQATKLLMELRQLTGSSELLFPHARRPNEPMSRNTFIRALRDYMKLPTTAHGFRHLASTTLNSQGYNRDWIEVQLAHWNEGARGAYNKAQWLPERRRMMQRYADWLDGLRNLDVGNVVQLQSRSAN
jgi:integrase